MLQPTHSEGKAESMLRQKNRHLTVLNGIIGIAASARSLDAMLAAALERTLQLTELDTGIIYLLNADRTQAIIRQSQNVPAAFTSRYRIIPLRRWPCDVALLEQKSRFINAGRDAAPLEAEFQEEWHVASLACIPLIAEDATIGAILIGSRAGKALSDEEQMLLETIGRELGSGIFRMELQQQLEAANREVNLYLDILTHDIKNALNVSTLYADLLLDTPDTEYAEHALKLRMSVQRSIEILQMVSTIRRIHQESDRQKPIDLDGVAVRSIGDHPGTAIRYEGCSARVWADDLLTEVFANLIGNAAKFGGHGVSITISTKAAEDGFIQVTVEDTGPGVPDAMKEAIFYRFERGRASGCGEGLGLFIVKTLVERYGGRIWVDDRVAGQPGEGAAFRFTLKKHEKEYA